MKTLTGLILLCLGTLWLFIGQSCTPKKATSLPKPPPASVLINTNFTSQSLNDRVLVCTKLTKKDLTRKDLKTWIVKNTVKVSQKRETIFLGSYRQYPEAWFYVQLINHDSLSRQLVIDEDNRIRCDAFEVFTFKDGDINEWGSINRSTPFSDYPIPFLTFAIPITINPKDTLNLLIHTERYYGRMEVNLNVASYQNYVGEHISDSISKIIQVIIFIICILTMFVLGGIFRFKAMIYLGYFLVSVLFIHLTSWGVTDAAMTFKSIGLSANNVAVFAFFVSNFLILPFLMEWMKIVPKNEKIHKGISYFIMGVSLFAACCFFVPASVFPRVNDFFSLPQLMVILVLATLIWMFFCGVLAFIRTGIYYILIGFVVSFLPFLLQQLSSSFAKSSIFLTRGDSLTFGLVAIGLSIISIYLLREQLVTRKNLKESLVQMNESMESIRKTEVEAIGRNLHDNIGNILASALGYLNFKKTNIATTENLIKEAIQEVRFLSHNLVKDDDKPLVVKIDTLVSRFNDFSKILFTFRDFSAGNINQLDTLKQKNIYMIIQECLTNIIKHSEANEAYIQIFEQGNTFQINIEDDGIGMINYQENNGIGLQNIHKRAEIAQLKLTFDSTQTGTSIIIETHYEK